MGKWQYAVYGFIFGATIAGALVYLAVTMNNDALENRIFDLERDNRALKLDNQKKEISMLEKRRDELDAELQKSMMMDKIASLEEEVKNLGSEKSGLLSQIAVLKAQLADLSVAKFENAANTPPPSADNASSADEDAKAVEKIAEGYKEILKKITMVGGPLGDFPIKDLGLDNAQVEGVNEALKNEEERIRKRFAEIAEDAVPGRTRAELDAMDLTGLSSAMLPAILKEIAPLQNLNQSDIAAIQKGEKSVTEFLSKDGLFMRLGKAMFEERETTYKDVSRFLPDEKEKLLKEKYLKPGGFFIKPGFSFDMGKVTRETFEKK
jgi:hypothetical protein